MGCLPGLVLFLLATAVGWWLGGASGVVWGAMIGGAAGLLTTVAMIMLLRRASRGRAGNQLGPSADKLDQ